MRSTFKQLFYINRQKEKKNGKCPVMGRITIDGKVCQYSTGYEIDPCLWNPSTGRAFTSGKIMEVLTAEEKTNIKRLNMQLDGLIKKGEEAYKRNLAGIGYVSAEIVKNAILDADTQKEGLLELMADYNDEYKKRIGIDRCAASFQKFRRTVAVLHGDGGSQGLARVGLVGDGLNPSVLQVLRVRHLHPYVSLGHGERPGAVRLLRHGNIIYQTRSAEGACG